MRALTFIICLFQSIAHSQTTLFTEDFEGFGFAFDINTTDVNSRSGTLGDHNWVMNNDFVSMDFTSPCTALDQDMTDTPLQPGGFAGGSASNHLHMISDESIAIFAYNSNYIPADPGGCYEDTNYFSRMSIDVNTVGMTDVEYSFWWICDGDNYAYGEVYYSLNGGGSWTKVVGTGPGNYDDQLVWGQTTLSLPAWDDQPFLRFGFRFVNNLNPVTDAVRLGFAVDEITLVATDDGSCSDSFYNFSVNECNYYTVPSGDETYTSSGIVNDTIPNAEGCDSVLTITMDITEVDDSVWITADEDSIVANADDLLHTFQWYDCDGDSIIDGETDQVFLPTWDGSFACIVSDGACEDTSDCITLWVAAADETSKRVRPVLYPNPSGGIFSIAPNGLSGPFRLSVSDMQGRLVFEQSDLSESQLSNLAILASQGIYQVQLVSEDGKIETLQIIVE